MPTDVEIYCNCIERVRYHVSVADTVLVLYQGKLIFHDTPEKMQECDHPFVQSFLADPEQL